MTKKNVDGFLVTVKNHISYFVYDDQIAQKVQSDLDLLRPLKKNKVFWNEFFYRVNILLKKKRYNRFGFNL